MPFRYSESSRLATAEPRSDFGAFGLLAVTPIASSPSLAPWHFLYFFPLPHGQGSFRPTLGWSRMKSDYSLRNHAITPKFCSGLWKGSSDACRLGDSFFILSASYRRQQTGFLAAQIPAPALGANAPMKALERQRFLVSLIHPARFRSAVALVHVIIGRNVIPVLVKVHIAVVLPHVDFKLPRRPPPLPAIVGIVQSVIPLGNRDPLRHAALGRELHIKVAKEQPARVRQIRDPASAADGQGRRNDDQNQNEIFCLDEEGERNHHDFVLAKDHAEGHENGKNAAGCADGDCTGSTQNVGKRENNRGDCSANYAGEKQFQKSPHPPRGFEARAEQPQAEHVTEPVPEGEMNEAVSDELPDGEMKNRHLGHEPQILEHPLRKRVRAEGG